MPPYDIYIIIHRRPYYSRRNQDILVYNNTSHVRGLGGACVTKADKRLQKNCRTL